jgi:hypothetical protein
VAAERRPPKRHPVSPLVASGRTDDGRGIDAVSSAPSHTYSRHVDLQHARDLSLSGADLMLLRAGLRAYLQDFEAHAAEDGHASHDLDEVATLRRAVGKLIWRLENAGAPPGAAVKHSKEAIEPLDGE